MIVGSGMVAKAFEDYARNESILIFASGVSNSKEICIKFSIIQDTYCIIFSIIQKNKYPKECLCKSF